MSPEATPPAVGLDDDLVTVVIPARNEERAIGPCLEAILASDVERLQVVVVDGASTDGTAEVVRRIAAEDDRVELLANPDAIIPIGLNLALAAARGAWFVRVDAHATVPPNYIGLAVERLRAGWGGVGGRKDGVGRTPAGLAIAAAMASRFGVGGSTYHHGTEPREVEHVPFGAYPTALARALGGWDERLRVNQDFEFDHRVRLAGHRILFDPALAIAWESRQSVPDLYRQYRRYGQGKVVVMALHPESVKVRHFMAPGLVAGLAASVALAAWRGEPRWLAAVSVPYAAALASAGAVTARAVPAGSRRWVVPAFATMHLGWGLGFWAGVVDILRRRTAAWPRLPRGEADRRRAAALDPHPDLVHAVAGEERPG